MDAETKAEKLRHDERILQAIDKCISSREDHYERNKGILTEILDDLFTKIKGRDGFFREQFQEFFFIEKHYKGPTNIKPEEFDVYIIIKIPLNIKDILFHGDKPGYKQLQFYNPPRYAPQWHKYSNFLSAWLVPKKQNDRWTIYELNQVAFRQSMESLLARTMLNIPRIDNYTIKVLEERSVFTLSVNKQDFPEMNVSLMPVLEVDCTPPYSLAKEGFKWYTIPDGPRYYDNPNYLWRPFLYNHENDILTRHSYVMPVIRELEKLRDTQEWKDIHHYHIKTLLMQYARSILNDSGLPDTCKLTGIQLFIHVLDRLRNMCKTKHLENFWVSGHNLIRTTCSQFADIENQLTKMIDDITDDSAKLADWILTPEDLSTYQNELKALETIPDTDCSSKSLPTNEGDEPGSTNDIDISADGVSRSVPDATAVSRDIESPPSLEAANDEASGPDDTDMPRVIAAIRNSIKTLSGRVSALEQEKRDALIQRYKH